MTCWPRLRDRHQAEVREKLHQLLLVQLHAAGKTIALPHWFRRLPIRWEAMTWC